jgi:hypothetical protein
MRDDRDEHDELVVAGATCPVPDCGALVISYRPRGARQSSASTACTEPRENVRLEDDVVSRLVHSSMRQYAVISVRSEQGCERLVIEYPDEKSLRDLVAAPSIVGLGYHSREEAQANIDGCTTAAHSSPRKLTATSFTTDQSLKRFVANREIRRGEFNLARTWSIVRGLAQHSIAVAIAVFYSKNLWSAAVRALISF